MTLDEVKELIELVAAKGFAEFEIARSDFKLKIVANVAPPATAPFAQSQGLAGAPAPTLAIAPPVAAPVEPAPVVAPAPVVEEDLFIVKSPIVGTFYRSPSPATEPFVKVGDNIDVGAVLCIVEAMKLMNEIEAEQAGEIVKIFVDNGQPVEYGQPLFGIRA